MTRRVAITGLGLVTPVGNDVASTWAALVDGQSGAGPITRFDSAQLPVHFACEVKGYDPLQYIDKKEARRYDLFSQFAMGAAVQAVRDACLEKSPLDPKRIGVIIGSGTGGIATFEENMRTFIEKGPGRVSPFFVPMFMANVASAIVSMRFGFQGPCYCTVSACASSGHAVGDAFDLIRENKADVMVAGGSEAAITPLALASFANMKALSERNDDPKPASRPFDKDRDGFVMGDGAA
ncbi:MAG: beta-ketoacyl-[acyl-carrier-protein] synthase II, partial [Gemmatimonadetes bacterium]